MDEKLQQIVNDGVHTLNAGFDFLSTLREVAQKAYQLGLEDGEEFGFSRGQELVGL